MTTRRTIPLGLADGGPRFWRGLEELADTEAFREMMHREFPEQASEWSDPLTRRRFLTLDGPAQLGRGGLLPGSQLGERVRGGIPCLLDERRADE